MEIGLKQRAFKSATRQFVFETFHAIFASLLQLPARFHPVSSRALHFETPPAHPHFNR
jgi:hypothetical protein